MVIIVMFLLHNCSFYISFCLCIRLGLLYIFYDRFFVFDFVFSVLAKRLAVKSVSEMTYFMSSGTLDLISINYRHILQTKS